MNKFAFSIDVQLRTVVSAAFARMGRSPHYSSGQTPRRITCINCFVLAIRFLERYGEKQRVKCQHNIVIAVYRDMSVAARVGFSIGLRATRMPDTRCHTH